MADTIISNTPSSRDDDSAGWVVALVIVIAAVIGGVVLYQNGFFGTNTPDTTNIKVTVPNSDVLNPTTPTPTTE